MQLTKTSWFASKFVTWCSEIQSHAKTTAAPPNPQSVCIFSLFSKQIKSKSVAAAEWRLYIQYSWEQLSWNKELQTPVQILVFPSCILVRLIVWGFLFLLAYICVYVAFVYLSMCVILAPWTWEMTFCFQIPTNGKKTTKTNKISSWIVHKSPNSWVMAETSSTIKTCIHKHEPVWGTEC